METNSEQKTKKVRKYCRKSKKNCTQAKEQIKMEINMLIDRQRLKLETGLENRQTSREKKECTDTLKQVHSQRETDKKIDRQT